MESIAQTKSRLVSGLIQNKILVMSSEKRGTKWVLQIFIVLYFLSAMGAYSLFGVPIQWLSLLGIMSLTFWIISKGRLAAHTGITVLIALVGWALFITVFNMVVSDASTLMPPKATTGYLPYVGLRVLNILAFAAVINCTSWLLNKNQGNKIIEAISTIGVVISLYALYAYVAQVYGLPEIPRSRIGTSGGEQSVKFSYAFHRAMGSFREPSHLAEWLMLPFMISFTCRKFPNTKALIISATILLSGSLTGIFGVIGGFCVAAALSLGHWSRVGSQLTRVFLPIALAGLIFSAFVSVNEKKYGGLAEVMWSRIEPIFKEGVKGTDRNYVYTYTEKHPAKFFGEGLGNANLRFSKDQKLEATASFLNLYLNTLYSLGYLGLALLIWFILSPLLIVAFRNRLSHNAHFYFILSGYCGWIIIFFSHAEELSYQFGVAYALLVYLIRNSTLSGQSERIVQSPEHAT